MKQFTDEKVEAKVADAIRTGMTQPDEDLPAAIEPPEMREAKELARRYRLPFVNLLPQEGESPSSVFANANSNCATRRQPASGKPKSCSPDSTLSARST